jgi:hypothetical protein
VEGYYGGAWVQNIKSGWTCKAHRPALYLMPDGQQRYAAECTIVSFQRE